MGVMLRRVTRCASGAVLEQQGGAWALSGSSNSSSTKEQKINKTGHWGGETRIGRISQNVSVTDVPSA
jgi:hypothetical protein